MSRLAGCESTNHTNCNLEGGLWQCGQCKRWMCLEEGMPDDGYYEHCDVCWAKEAQPTTEVAR